MRRKVTKILSVLHELNCKSSEKVLTKRRSDPNNETKKKMFLETKPLCAKYVNYVTVTVTSELIN